MTPEQKEWIDNASYEQLLGRWRFSPMGNPIFRDEAGKHYLRVMCEKRDAMGDDAAAAVSKRVGWEG